MDIFTFDKHSPSDYSFLTNLTNLKAAEWRSTVILIARNRCYKLHTKVGTFSFC